MIIVRAAHWLLPWFILILGLTAMVRFVRGHVNETPFPEGDRRLVVIFSGLMDLQGALGLVFFIWSGFARTGFPLYRILHALTMFVAMMIPHVSLRWRNIDKGSLNLHYFYTLLASFLVVMVGISLIPQ